MSEIKIEVLSRLEAGEILCTPDRCAEITYLVSIGDADDPLPEGYENAARKERLLIADVVTEEGATEEDGCLPTCTIRIDVEGCACVDDDVEHLPLAQIAPLSRDRLEGLHQGQPRLQGGRQLADEVGHVGQAHPPDGF